ncbi:hypothetical protein HK098_000931 [Nowakowskiella sp. JEL0407]|nr:hypothetical protein HK098_000931 [Nowakowskiella sp. JEL0407]
MEDNLIKFAFQTKSEFQEIMNAVEQLPSKNPMNWKLEHSSSRMIIYTNTNGPGGSKWPIWAASSEMNFPIESIFELIATVQNRSTWDPLLVVFRAVQFLNISATSNLTAKVVYSATSSMFKGLISARDYLDVSVTEKTDGYCDMSWKSLNEQDTRLDKSITVDDAIRGWNYIGGIRIRRLGPNKSLVTYVVSSNLKGSV